MHNKKQILVAVTGGSPQVITETLYGLHQQNQKPNAKHFWPQEIHILTTEFGKNEAKSHLLMNPIVENGSTYVGQLARFCAIYQLPLPLFTEQHIHVIPNAQGEDVDDARTAEDQDALADFIMKAIAQLTMDDNTQIHASIAGGRKTMGYYLGSAMGMFGRVGDSLSHVLVTEGYENLPSFYFPTLVDEFAKSQRLNKTINFKDAKVELANIAFIRQRQMFDTHVLAEFSKANVLKLADKKHQDADFPLSYLDLVNYQTAADLVRYAEDKHAALQQFKLDFDLKNLSVKVSHPLLNDMQPREIDFSQDQLALCFYSMIARHNNANDIAIKGVTDGVQDAQSGMFFVLELLRIRGANQTQLKKLQQLADSNNIETFHSAIKTDYFTNLLFPFKGATLNKVIGYNKTELSLNTETPNRIGLDKQFIADRNNELKKLLAKYFPEEFFRLIVPTGVWQVSKERNSTKVDYYQGNKKKDAAFGLWVSSKLEK